MPKRTLLYASLVLCFICFAGCGILKKIQEANKGSDKNMRVWFEWATELKLPKEAQFIEGKNCAAWLGDYYLILKVPPGYKEILDKNLTPADKTPSYQIPSLTLPTGAKSAKWDLSAKTLVYYEKTTGDVEEGEFLSRFGFDESTGILYCRFTEYAP